MSAQIGGRGNSSRDPLDGVNGTATVANPYHYADNDPLNKTDPTGLRPGDCEVTGKAAECEEIRRVLGTYLGSTWRAFPFTLNFNCDSGYVSGSNMCVVKEGVKRNWDMAGLYQRMAPTFEDAFEHIVLHEFGHIVNFNLESSGRAVKNGWPGNSDTRSWCRIMTGSGSPLVMADCLGGLSNAGVHEYIADCFAQKFKTNTKGGYWLKYMPAGSDGCPRSGRLAMYDYYRQNRNYCLEATPELCGVDVESS